ncbi:MAG: threonine aldolase family protein [Candidatus Onthomorpha sp.]
MLHFDTDYMRGACPEIIKRICETNLEQTVGYGLDEYTQRAKEAIRQTIGRDDAEIHFLVGGTQTNATVIDGVLGKCEGVLCAETAHINVHEAGAIEASGHKVLTLPTEDGKIKAEDVEKYVRDFNRDEARDHIVAPGMVYISFPTETGSLYTLKELEDLHRVCSNNSLPLYIDGARLGYGLMARGNDVSIKDIARLCDIFYIGGTKVGALFGEAVVVCNNNLLKHFFPLIKQHGALLAKGRLLGLQFETLFTDNLYFKLSNNAIERAMELREAFVAKGYEPYGFSPSNQQFFVMSKEEINALKAKVSFEIWAWEDDNRAVVRFVTDWATSKQEVMQLIDCL